MDTKVGNPTIMGIDPGSNHCGWSVYVGTEYRDGGCICLRGDRMQRLTRLSKSLDALFGEWRPNVVGVETVWVPRRRQSAAQVAQTSVKIGEVRGVVISAAIRAGATWVDVAPATAKKALTGSGKATKEQMQQFAKMILGVDVNEHQADAMGVAEAAMNIMAEELMV